LSEGHPVDGKRPPERLRMFTVFAQRQHRHVSFDPRAALDRVQPIRAEVRVSLLRGCTRGGKDPRPWISSVEPEGGVSMSRSDILSHGVAFVSMNTAFSLF